MNMIMNEINNRTQIQNEICTKDVAIVSDRSDRSSAEITPVTLRHETIMKPSRAGKKRREKASLLFQRPENNHHGFAGLGSQGSPPALILGPALSTGAPSGTLMTQKSLVNVTVYPCSEPREYFQAPG